MLVSLRVGVTFRSHGAAGRQGEELEAYRQLSGGFFFLVHFDQEALHRRRDGLGESEITEHAAQKRPSPFQMTPPALVRVNPGPVKKP